MPAYTKERPEAGTLLSPKLPQTEAVTRSHRELVSRIVASTVFARTERLSALLSYVCEMALEGRAAELNEQAIGQAVFGRSREYDASADGIVRTQASRLRQRLNLFFQQEGSQEPIEIVIPRGGYIPQFRPRARISETDLVTAVGQVGMLAPQEPSTPQEAKPRSRWLNVQPPWLLSFFLACTLILVSSIAWKRGVHNTGPVHPLWGRMFKPNYLTLEVPGDSGLVLSYTLGERSLSLHDYLTGEFRAHGDTARDADLNGHESLIADFATRRYTSIVDLDVAVRLGQLAQTAHSSLEVKYARDLRPNDLKNGNVILIGAREANPWVELFEYNMNFVLQDYYPGKVFSVLNKRPQPGEQSHWEMTENDPLHRVYGVVAFLPNLSENGEALIIEGTSMAGTEAAWDFVSEDAELLPFLKEIQRSNGTIPHFELLVETQNISGSAARNNLIAWRIQD